MDLARALTVSADELLGLKPVKQTIGGVPARIVKRLQMIDKLPVSDQRAVFKFIDALVLSRLGTSKRNAA